MENQKQYIAIDLKSFYASVEAVERGLDPLDVNLVVADESRTDKTICLAVSPPLKAVGVPGRGRLFEAKQRVAEVNRERRRKVPGGRFTGKSCFASELAANPFLELDFIIASPRMKYYMEYSRRIVGVYFRHVSPEDVLVYSVDEVFIDVTAYLALYNVTAHELAVRMIQDVLRETGITATAGIGTNMYLAKVAMDIVAKHMPADSDGVRIAELDEMSYREKLWCHRPLTDFWRVGPGTAKRLESHGLYTMGDIARCSEGRENSRCNEEMLYRLFGVNAELLIDHAWGFEPVEIADCKAYRPESKSISQGQVLTRPYTVGEGRIVIREMADSLSMDLVRKGLLTDRVEVYVSYDTSNLSDPVRVSMYRGPVVRDYYGRDVPKGVHGFKNLERKTDSTRLIVAAVSEIYDRIVDRNLLVRRFNIALEHIVLQADMSRDETPVQLNLFTDYEALEREKKAIDAAFDKEHRMQEALLCIRDKYGKNAIVRGMNMLECATAMERNRQIGGHKA